jgi:hypothetical protein
MSTELSIVFLIFSISSSSVNLIMPTLLILSIILLYYIKSPMECRTNGSLYAYTSNLSSCHLRLSSSFWTCNYNGISHGSIFDLIGIYNSAILVSANNELRKSIYKHAIESRLLRLIGQAEMEREIEKIVRKISRDKNILEIDTEQRRSLEIDEKGLKNI